MDTEMRERCRVICGDCREVMREMEADSISAIVTDPPYGLEFMGKEWDTFKPSEAHAEARTRRASEMGDPSKGPYLRSGVNAYHAGSAYQQWCEEWAREALRVLKPGGHLLAAGGPRTYHRMACAIEDAGFEIRDSIHHIFGSGFPKSANISKAIDRMAGAEREVVGTWTMPGRGKRSPEQRYGLTNDTGAITAPATDDAKRWAGYGTALKPSHEAWVLARKPLGDPPLDVVQAVNLQLRQNGLKGAIQWNNDDAKPAGKSKLSRSSTQTRPHTSAGEISAEHASGIETHAIENGIENWCESKEDSGEHSISTGCESIPPPEARDCGNRYSKPTVGNAPVVENPRLTSSPSTTSMEAEQSIVSTSEGMSTESFDGKDSHRDTGFSAGTAIGESTEGACVRTSYSVQIRGETYQIECAEDGALIWPIDLPKRLPGRPLTVAANVLTHGTGAINVDGCRVGTAADMNPRDFDDSRRSSAKFNGMYNGGKVGEYLLRTGAVPDGRWPSNLVFSHAPDCGEECVPGCAVAELDEQAGVRQSGTFSGVRSQDKFQTAYGTFKGTPEAETGHEGSSGPASRFFPVFRYEPKAATSERTLPNGERSHHPTVKPVELIRWMLRLVTPPGGVVLDPFAGSCTTLVAGLMEGVQVIGIEISEEYCRLGEERLRRVQMGFPLDGAAS